jgi:hypothetical protein
MLSKVRLYHAVAKLVILLIVSGIAAAAKAQDTVYLLPYFRSNGETGVFLAASDDGLTFRDLNNGQAIFAPPMWPNGDLTRDPAIAIGPDGTFHMVWTTHWWVKNIGHASSKDLKTWSEPQQIEVWPADAKVANSWAPEIMYDEANKQFQIVWASTNSDDQPGEGTSENGGPAGGERRMEHRLYAKTTADFKDFSETKLFYDGGFSVIDGMIAHDAANDRYAMIVKNETRYPEAKKNLHLLFSKSAAGPFSDIVGPIAGPGAPRRSEWVEGPTLIKIGDLWHLYFDSYTRPQHLSVMTSPDLVEWTDKTADAQFPRGGRHGTVFAAPRAKVAWLSTSN